MRRFVCLFSVLLCSNLWPGCSCSDDGGPGPCDVTPVADGCGEPCDDGQECPSGFFCGSDLTCTADCSSDGSGCGSNERCTSEGRCVPSSTFDGSTFNGDSSNVCAEVEVGARRVTPTIIMIVDKSGTMPLAFAGGSTGQSGESRWDAVRETLLDPTDGVVAPLADQVRFGVSLYTATNGGDDSGPAEDPCPIIETIAPDLNNFDAIEAGYQPRSWRRVSQNNTQVAPPDPDGFVGEDTPTGDSIAAVTQRLADAGTIPSPSDDPVVYLLATDGEPDSCEDGDPSSEQGRAQARQKVIDAVRNANTTYGVRTFALFVGRTMNDTIRSHMTDVARTGGTGQFFEATGSADLRDDISAIVRGQVSCELVLEGSIPDLSRACEGTVSLDGRALECGTDWMAVSENRIEILGTACDELQAGATLRATFPCDAVILL